MTRAPGASEAAQVVAKLAVSIPDEAARDLARLLSHSLAAPSRARIRQGHLGLLVELMNDSGEVPDTETYDRTRAERAALGEQWPDRTTLAKAYGHWNFALRAAMRHYVFGGCARVQASHRHARSHRPTYTRADVLDALVRCRQTLGLSQDDWPTEWEFEEWSHCMRRIARLTGKPDPRLPTAKPIRTSFGDYAGAVRAAKRLTLAASSHASAARA